jgi:uncharacterized membrane protein (DUF4010 family)
MLAWIVMFGRALVEVATVNFALVSRIWLPMLLTAGAGLLYGIFLYVRGPDGEDQEEVTLTNPFELGPAITFALIYVVVLLISRAGQTYFGDTGVYISSLVAGLADVDAITLSMADLSAQPGGLDPDTASRAIMIAALTNTFTKGGIVLFTGSPTLRRALLPGLLLMLVVGALATILM